MLPLEQYTHWFTHLHRSTAMGGAPHKPVLLLAVMELVQEGEITDHRLEITPALVIRFKELWRRLVKTGHSENFVYPFFFMRSEPFWKLVAMPGKEFELTKSKSIKSLASLRNSLLYAELDEGLFAAMCLAESNSALTHAILKTYFGVEQMPQLQPKQLTITEELDMLVLGEIDGTAVYRAINKQSAPDQEMEEEFAFIRGGAFKRNIPKVYNYTCAISEMKISTPTNMQMVDACHIKPFAEYGLDGVTNGICLSPNLHRAFDRGLISIDTDYRLMVSSTLSESPSAFSIRQFEGKKIHLPTNQLYWPAMENLEWHRGRWGM